MEEPRILTAGDRAVSVVFGDRIDKEINGRARALRDALAKRNVPGIVETVTTYAALTIHFAPEKIRRKDLIALIEELLPAITAENSEEKPVKEIPVLYGGPEGPDLPDCAEKEGKTDEEIIRIHTSHEHYIYMLGFSPGHPYSARSEEPFSFGRRETPRVEIPARSVVVQRNLTNITPFAQPCGWQVIGSTPINITDYSRENPFFLEAGDRIRFRSIGREEYDKLREKGEKAKKELPSENTPSDMEILSPGLLTTVQDAGRFGYQAYGVSPAGPMDQRAFRLANLLVGNTEKEAALELCAAGPEIRMNTSSVIALCGADFGLKIDGKECPSYAAVPVKAGQVISFTPCRRGRYGVLAFAGGILVPKVMGSRSTLIKNQLGGMDGRKLKTGDTLGLGRSPLTDLSERRLVPEVPAAKEEAVTLRVVKGPQDDMFTRESLRYFFHHGAVVTDSCDRQGARLASKPLQFAGAKDIVSDGISFGAIQVPGDGQPIILLADRQTTGGYCKLGTVISVDLPKAGQLCPGQKVRFIEVSPETAELLYLREKEAFRKLEEEWNQGGN